MSCGPRFAIALFIFNAPRSADELIWTLQRYEIFNGCARKVNVENIADENIFNYSRLKVDIDEVVFANFFLVYEGRTI